MDKPKSTSFLFFFNNRIEIANSFVVNPEQKASHPLIITQQKPKKKKARSWRGVYSLIYLYLINPSLFIKMGESRLKMNLLYTSSPVKGHSVQCSWCLQCVSTRDMLQFGCVSGGLNRSQHSNKFPAASSHTEMTHTHTVSWISSQVILNCVTCYDEGNLKRRIDFW